MGRPASGSLERTSQAAHNKGPLSGVGALMATQVARSSGAIAAHAAREGLLPGVGALMLAQGACITGAIAAHAAREGLLPGVDALMDPQVARSTCTVPAPAALKVLLRAYHSGRCRSTPTPLRAGQRRDSACSARPGVCSIANRATTTTTCTQGAADVGLPIHRLSPS